MESQKLPTYQMLLVLGSILSSKGGRLYGAQYMKSHNFVSGTLYPLLRRLQEEGMLTAEREIGDTKQIGRPLRTYYRLTNRGTRYAKRYNATLIAANPPLVPFRDFT